MPFQAPRGTEDVLPSDSHRWSRLESIFRELSSRYGYHEVRTPTFEDTSLFVRTSGDTSDIVSKEMYTFSDKGGRDLTLKPEGTAPIMRAVIEHNLCPPGAVLRMSYIMPIFRYGRPQKGRYREAHQVGLEILGSPSPAADAEIIEMTVKFYDLIGIEGAEVKLSTLGREECRVRFREAILEHTRSFLADQPEEARSKVERNPLRMLDSKDPDTQAALQGLRPILDFLEPESRANFDTLQELLQEADIRYQVDPSIVRGLDYYTETVFEVQSSKLGAQSSLCGGGRYDCLSEELGGRPLPAVGVAMGIERALLVLDELGKAGESDRPDLFVVTAGNQAAGAARELARKLRSSGYSVLLDIDQKSLKSQLRQADKSGARYAAIIGEDELGRGTAQLRDLATSEQSEIPLEEIARHLGGKA